MKYTQLVVNFELAVKYGRDMNMELAIASGGRYYDLEDLKKSWLQYL